MKMKKPFHSLCLFRFWRWGRSNKLFCFFFGLGRILLGVFFKSAEATKIFDLKKLHQIEYVLLISLNTI